MPLPVSWPAAATPLYTRITPVLFLNIPQLWLTLAERHLEQRGVDWKQAEKICFNEWSNPDDEELGIQIVKVRLRNVHPFYNSPSRVPCSRKFRVPADLTTMAVAFPRVHLNLKFKPPPPPSVPLLYPNLRFYSYYRPLSKR